MYYFINTIVVNINITKYNTFYGCGPRTLELEVEESAGGGNQGWG